MCALSGYRSSAATVSAAGRAITPSAVLSPVYSSVFEASAASPAWNASAAAGTSCLIRRSVRPRSASSTGIAGLSFFAVRHSPIAASTMPEAIRSDPSRKCAVASFGRSRTAASITASV